MCVFSQFSTSHIPTSVIVAASDCFGVCSLAWRSCGINGVCEHGLLIADPHDLDAFAAALSRLLGDQALATRIGAAGRERVRDLFLGDKHLIRYIEVFARLLGT